MSKVLPALELERMRARQTHECCDCMYDDRPWWRRCIDIAVGTFLVLLAAVGAVVAAGFIIVFVAL